MPKFNFAHNNINVFDLERSLKFYEDALGLKETRRHTTEKYIIVFLADGYNSPHRLELTWLADKKKPYELGDNEVHVAFNTDDFDAAYQKHKEMGCICYENKEGHLYFIADPDGYWIEILPEGRGR